MLHLIFSVPCLYVLVRFVAPLPWPLAFKVALGAAMLVASQYHLWYRLSSGSVFSPEFPRLLVLAFNGAFGSILLLAAFQIALDLGLLAMALSPPGATVPTTLRYVGAGLAMVLAVVGVAQAARVPPVREIEVEIEGLPHAFDGYRGAVW